MLQSRTSLLPTVVLVLFALVAGGCATPEFLTRPDSRTTGPVAAGSHGDSRTSDRPPTSPVEASNRTSPSTSTNIGLASLEEEKRAIDPTRPSKREHLALAMELRALPEPHNGDWNASELLELESLALATNPALQQLDHQIESLRGKHLQAGLPPNPRLGVNGDDINEEGQAGRYGLFIGREEVRGNKLGLSQSVVCAELAAAERQRETIRQKLLNDVRSTYYELLIAQEKIEIAGKLAELSKNAVDASQRLLEAREAARTSVLQSELEYQNALVLQRQAENQRLASRRRLAALLREDDLPDLTVSGEIRDVQELADFEGAYDELVNTSPEIQRLFADVEVARRRLARAEVEAIPNMSWQTTLQYDTPSDDIVAGFQVGFPIPTRNANQGAIHQAQFALTALERKAEVKALDLRTRLTTAYETYIDAKLQLDAYDDEILPRAQESLDLVSTGYRQGELEFLELLNAQRTYSRLYLNYLDRLRDLWQQNVAIRGLLLSGSLKNQGPLTIAN